MALAVVFLTWTALPLPAEELWRSLLSAADELKSQGRFVESERKFWSAVEEARRLEPDLAPAATAYHNLAGLYQDTGRCDSAVRAYRQSLSLWDQVGPRGGRYFFQTANHLVGLDLQCGAVRDAEHHYRTLIAPRLAAWPAGDRDDPDVAQALTNRGSIDYRNRRYSEARAHYDEALAIRERLSAAPDTEKAVVLSNLALALLRVGDVARAVADSRRAVEMVEAVTAPADPLRVSVLVNGAELHALARRQAEAEALMLRALAISREAAGEEQPLTAFVMSHYATLLKANNRKREAAALEDHVRAIRMQFPNSAVQTVDVRDLARR